MELHCPRVHVRVCTRVCGGGRDEDCTEVLDVNPLSRPPHDSSRSRARPTPSGLGIFRGEGGGRKRSASSPPWESWFPRRVPQAPGLLGSCGFGGSASSSCPLFGRQVGRPHTHAENQRLRVLRPFSSVAFGSEAALCPLAHVLFHKQQAWELYFPLSHPTLNGNQSISFYTL